MKRFDMKGVSPVIATILLIALTVAAVGIVAVILSTIGTPSVTPAVTFGTPDAYVGKTISGTDNSAVVDLPIVSANTPLNMMDLKVYLTCYVENYKGGGSQTITYTAQLGNDGVKSVCSVSPPAPASGAPPSTTQGVYVQYYGTPVRSAGDKISFFFQSDDSTGQGTSKYLPTVVGGTVTIKVIYVPSGATMYQDTVMTRAKVW